MHAWLPTTSDSSHVVLLCVGRCVRLLSYLCAQNGRTLFLSCEPHPSRIAACSVCEGAK